MWDITQSELILSNTLGNSLCLLLTTYLIPLPPLKVMLNLLYGQFVLINKLSQKFLKNNFSKYLNNLLFVLLLWQIPIMFAFYT
jgi:hypothetical protein